MYFPLILLCKHDHTMQNPQFPQCVYESADSGFWLQLNEMVRAPGEGHFWQVDHIRPVFGGGGQCSLDNLQTLCTVCHREVSALRHPTPPRPQRDSVHAGVEEHCESTSWAGSQETFYFFHHLTLVFPLEA